AGKRRKRGAAKKPAASRKERKPVLSGLFQAGTELRKTFKGRECVATVASDGRISFGGRTFNSPSLAANYVRGGKHTNGWKFWNYRNERGEWAPLDELRKRG
ncbi:MAG: DUF2924 domain-containing protein, partial [Bacteroidota bacterium]